MKNGVLVLAGLVALSAGAAEVTFSGKTVSGISTSGPLAFVSLEKQAYTTGALWTGCSFKMAGGAAYFTPDVNVQTEAGGRWRATFRATEPLTLAAVTLQVPIYNVAGGMQGAGESRTAKFRLSVGNREVSETATLQGAVSWEESAAANMVTLTFTNAVSLAKEETLTLVCERASETKGCFFGLSRMTLTVPPEQTGILEVGIEGAEWPDIAPSAVRFAGGTLTVPAGVTVTGLCLTADSAGGTLRVLGTLEGRDSGEPGVTAFPLSAEVAVILESGASLFMNGRLCAPVTARGEVALGAATAGGTLRLDALDVDASASPRVSRGCVEVYRAPVFPAGEDALLWRWVRPGWRLSLR